MPNALVITAKTRREGFGTTIQFSFKLGQRLRQSGNRFSIPLSQSQAERLAHPLAVHHMAHGSVRFNIAHGKVTWGGFYPFGNDKNFVHRNKNSPKRLGIGTDIHAAVTRYVAENYPEHKIRHIGKIKPARRKQLREMGIKTNHEYTMPEYQKIVQAHQQRKQQKRALA